MMFSCQKDDEPTATSKDDQCITTRASDNGDVIEGQYIVSVVPDTNAADGRRQSVMARLKSEYNLSKEAVIESADNEQTTLVLKLSPSEAKILSQDKNISHIEPDRIVSICACFTVVSPRLVKWNISKVGYGNGSGKTAWVLDTGVDLNHPDLNIDKTRSRSYISGSSTAQDENGHGTHVAGVIGALNNDIGTLGVASGATIVALKILDSEGKGKLSTVMSALAYVRAHAKAGDVVNLSMGLDDTSDILDQEIQSLASRGIYFAIAAGNDKGEAKNFSPARAAGKNVYTVTAIDSLDRFASFSNYGNDVVDYAAPGVRILSSYKGGKYAIMSGTSMATPHVAGLLLLNNGVIHSYGNAIKDPDGVADPIAHQ
jgi:subtilisin